MKRCARIVETSKTVEIKSPSDQLKFTVQLEKREDVNPENPLEIVDVYQVIVMNYCESEEGTPAYTSEDYFSLREAEHDFNRCVRNYGMIVKAESQSVDDISVYADKIEYTRIDPDCCMNCQFCNMDYDRCKTAHHNPMRWHTLVCENPENFKFFENLVNPREYRDFMNRNFDNGFHPSMHDPCYDTWMPFNRAEHGDWRPLPPPHVMRNPHFYSLEVRPRVDFNGHCKHYKRRKINHPGCCHPVHPAV